MKPKARISLQIIHDILVCCKSPSLKCPLMYKANLYHGNLERYLRYMIDKGLINVTQEEYRRNAYKTTEKGLEFVKRFCNLMDLLQPDFLMKL